MDQHLCEAARSHPAGDGWSTFDKLWRTLIEKVHRRFWRLGWPEIEDAVATVLLRWLKREEDFLGVVKNGGEEAVLRSLYWAVCREVGHSRRANRRRGWREREYARQKKNCTGLDFFGPNGFSAGHILLEEQGEELERLLADCTEWERAFLKLRSEGIKELTPYAELLGMAGCTLEDQRQAVNRAWNRLRRKLQRMSARRAK